MYQQFILFITEGNSVVKLIPGPEIAKITSFYLKNQFFSVGIKYLPIHLNSEIYKQKLPNR